MQGRKYGLVGRNGIGKTTLINAICRKELDGFPEDCHILQVEQEVDGDDISILQHVLNCDVERQELIDEQHLLHDACDKKLSAYDKQQNLNRMTEIHDRLV